MYERIECNLSGEQIAEGIGISYSFFQCFFIEYIGFTFTQYILELKINKSKELLTNTELSCQEIAFELGVYTPFHFNMVFQKKAGMAPHQYPSVGLQCYLHLFCYFNPVTFRIGYATFVISVIGSTRTDERLIASFV